MENQLPKTTLLDMDKWRDIIEGWGRSGENQKTYCNRLGLSINTFAYVRSKLLQQEKQKNPFVRLSVKNSVVGNISNPSITLENPRGYKLNLSADLSLDQLSRLFKLSGWSDA